MEGQPAPAEQKVQKENEIRDAISPSVGHIAFGAVDRGFLKPVEQRPTNEQRANLLAATPDALNPIAEAVNAVSMDSRREAPEMGEKQWNEKVWSLLNGYVADTVDAPLREERLKAFASLDLKLENAEQDANGLYTQVETFRQKYVDYDSSNIGQFIEDVARDCKGPDGSVDIKALQTRMHALEPVLGIFGPDNDVKELINDFAVAHGLLTQKDDAKTVAVNKAAFEVTRPFHGTQETRIAKLWNKLKPDTERDETPPQKETDAPEVTPIAGRRVVGADGEGYTVIKTDNAGLATEVRSDKNQVFTADEAAAKIFNGSPDTIQSGTRVIRGENGQEYKVTGLIYRDKGEAWVDLQDADGRRLPLPVHVLRRNLQDEDGRWRLAEEEPPPPEKIPDEPLTPDLARSDPEKFKGLMIQKLGEKHPLAKQAWDKIITEGIYSLDTLILENDNMLSRNHGDKITLSVIPFPPALKEKIHFDDKSFSYEDEVLYRFSHEVSHSVIFHLTNTDQNVAYLLGNLNALRQEDDNRGLSALGSDSFYANRGENGAPSPDVQAKEDLTELVTMYLWDPEYFKRFTEFLKDPRYAGDRDRLKLKELDTTEQQYFASTIAGSTQAWLENGAFASRTPDQPAPPEQPKGAETIQLTDSANVVDEMKGALQATDRDQVTFESTPDVLLPFIEQKISERATITSPLQASIVDKPDGPGKQMHLKGTVKKLTVTVDFDITLENSPTGLAVVHENINPTGLGSGRAQTMIADALAHVDELLKNQIDENLEGAGKVQKLQIGDGVLVSDVKKG